MLAACHLHGTVHQGDTGKKKAGLQETLPVGPRHLQSHLSCRGVFGGDSTKTCALHPGPATLSSVTLSRSHNLSEPKLSQL